MPRWLTRQFFTKAGWRSTQEHLIERLEKLIFQISMVANISDESFGTSSGIAMKYKLQEEAEQECNILRPHLDVSRNAQGRDGRAFEEWVNSGKHPRELAKHLQKRFGVSAYNANRLMTTELARVQTEAQKQFFERNGYTQYTFLALGTACGICSALNDKHFNVKDMMPGKNATSMHPNCRCSVAAYMYDESYEEWLDAYQEHGVNFEEWNQLKNMASHENEIRWPKYGSPISKEQYRELSRYARDRGIVLEGFKRFDGDVNVIKEDIDDANTIAKCFPILKEGKRKLTISLDEYMDSLDFPCY